MRHYDDIEAIYRRPARIKPARPRHRHTGSDGPDTSEGPDGDDVFYVTPCPAPRMTRADAWKDRPCVLRYRAYRDQVRAEARRLEFQLPAVLNITFVLPMPESWSPNKRARMDGTQHQQKPDRDNLLKAFQDAFAGDDGFVWDGRTTKVWGEEGRIIVHGADGPMCHDLSPPQPKGRAEPTSARNKRSNVSGGYNGGPS